MISDVVGLSLLCLAAVGTVAVAATVLGTVRRLAVVGVVGLAVLLACAFLFVVSRGRPGYVVAALPQGIMSRTPGLACLDRVISSAGPVPRRVRANPVTQKHDEIDAQRARPPSKARAAASKRTAPTCRDSRWRWGSVRYGHHDASSLTRFASARTIRLKDAVARSGPAKRWLRDLWRRATETRGTGVIGTALGALALAGLLYVGYIFLDSSTRGHFTWSLRLLSIVAFAALFLLLAVMRHGR